MNKLSIHFFLTALLFLIGFSSCNDDSAEPSKVTIGFQSASTQTSEGVLVLNIPLSLQGKSSNSITVTYEVDASSSADLPLDVTPLTSTNFIIAPGASAYNMQFAILDDGILELEPEKLIIKIISVSEGAEIGSISSHTIDIEADDVSAVSFVQTQSNVAYGSNVKVDVTLSKSYSDDLTIEIDLSNHATSGSYSCGFFICRYYYFYTLSNTEGGKDNTANALITIPAGSTTGSIDLFFDSGFDDEEFEGKAIDLEIVSVKNSLGISPADAFVNTDDSMIIHSINVGSGGSLNIDISWTSTNNNVDLDLYLLDDDNNVILFSTEVGYDGSESLLIDSDIQDGSYTLVIQWYEGTGTADITGIITPNGDATWNDNSSEYIFASEIADADPQSNYDIITIDKTGLVYKEL